MQSKQNECPHRKETGITKVRVHIMHSNSFSTFVLKASLVWGFSLFSSSFVGGGTVGIGLSLFGFRLLAGGGGRSSSEEESERGSDEALLSLL